MSDPIDLAATLLLRKIQQFLLLNMGKSISEATLQEFFHAFSIILREEIMINWTATLRSFDKQKVKTLYYLSMEYLPGKYEISHIERPEIIQAVLTKAGHSLSDLWACEPEPGLGNGGLGRLASCFLESLATQQYPAFGYGLRYHYGIFDQELWQGKQVERPDCWLLNENPWEVRRDLHSQSVFFRGKIAPGTNGYGDEVYSIEDYEEVRALPYDVPIVGFTENSNFSVLSLRLWTTKESPRNFELQRYNAGQLEQAGENTSLTDVLYPNDNHETGKRIRLKQEFLLVSASLQDILHAHLKIYGNLASIADKVQIQINDTHPAFVIAELTRMLNKDFDLPWNRAWEITQTCCNYTNHTILRESLEEWNEKRVWDLLPRQYKIIQKINLDFCNQVRQKFSHDEERVKRMSIIENGQIRMAHLAILGSHRVNGVAELHSEILKHTIFKDFYEMFPYKFVNVTNGVTHRRWLLDCNPRLAKFITDRISSKWIKDFSYIEELASFASDKKSQEKFIELKKKNKEDFFLFLTSDNPIRDKKGEIIGHFPVLDPGALVDVHIKRFHEYKRQLMNALHLLMLFHEIKTKPGSRKIKRMVIIGGKAAPGYEAAKNILLLFFCIARKINADEEVGKLLKVAVVENYNVSKAEIIIPAADLSQQISTAGMEASGTGNMKLAMNGALTLGTEDGANIEMRKAVGDRYWPFSFGSSAEEIASMQRTQTNNAWDIYLHNDLIRKAIDSLKDGSLTKDKEEHAALFRIYASLLDGYYGPIDRYFVIHDLMSYYETQKKVEELYANPLQWAEYAIHNIAAMGKFSSDESIKNYSHLIWNLKKCPPNNEILNTIRKQYREVS